MVEIEPNPEQDHIVVTLLEAASEYLTDEDRDELAAWLIDGIADEQDYFGYVYGRLLELGYDPDEILDEHDIAQPKV